MERKINFICNREEISISIHPGITLLDFLRKNLLLTGTKEGCREGDCGACTVLVGSLTNKEVEYKSVNSCLLPIIDVNGKHVVTIEGLNKDQLSPVQTSFVDEGASQCGFCTPGFIVSLTGYLLSHQNFDKDDAQRLIEKTNIYTILQGVRGEPRSDIKGILEILVILGQLVNDFKDIVELDINPCLVFDEMNGYSAVDIKITINYE